MAITPRPRGTRDEGATRSDSYDQDMAIAMAEAEDPGTGTGPGRPGGAPLVSTDPGITAKGAVTADERNEEPMEDEEILSIVETELENSSAEYSGELAENRMAALRYYEGRMRPAPKGRSQAVSTDVADVIEWTLPQAVTALVDTENVVLFDAVNEEDENNAQLETDACEHVIFKENEGFVYVYSVVKDALLQKNGVGKIFWDKSTSVEYETYTGLTEEEAQTLLNPQDGSQVQVVEADVNEGPPPPQQPPPGAQAPGMPGMQPGAMPGMQPPNPMAPPGAQGMMPGMMPPQPQPQYTYDLTIRRYRSNGGVKVLPLPGEEFLVNRDHNSIILDDARFTGHKRISTESELIAEGWDEDIVRDLPSYTVDPTGEREERRSLEDEKDFGYDASDRATRRIQVIECYAHVDQDRDGIAELLQVHVAGDSSYVMMGWERVACNPFVGTTPFLLTHKFYGRSLFDKVKEIQDQKTALVRAIQDNLDHQNNARTLVVAGQVNLDDMLTSRPGGIVRQKAPGMVEPLVAPQIGELGYRHLEYLDNVRTGRAGVSPDTAAVAHAIAGDTAHGLERLMSAKEELTGLIIKLMAHTLMKGTIKKVRQLLQQHRDTPMHFKVRGAWQQVNPSQWQARTGASVKTALSYGDRMKKAQSLSMTLEQQRSVWELGGDGVLVTMDNIYNTLTEFARSTQVGDPSPYWTDPKSPEAMQAAQAKAQAAQEQQQQAQQAQQMMLQAQMVIEENKELTKRAQAMMQDAQAQAKLALEAQRHFDELTKDYTKIEVDAGVDIALQGMKEKPTPWSN